MPELASNSLCNAHGGMYTPSGDSPEFTRGVADRLERIIDDFGLDAANPKLTVVLRDLARECRVDSRMK